MVMDFSLQQKRLTYLHVQRNILAGIVAVGLIVLLLQTWLLFFKQERVIISPPELNQSYWVEGHRFSASYLEEMAVFFSHLMLDVTESNVLAQGDIVLRYVLPEAYGTFKAKILDDRIKLQKMQLSLHFTPKTIEVVAGLVVEVAGVLAHHVASSRVAQSNDIYRITFANKKGRLFLAAFELIKSDKELPDA
ncbi:MAG TPA: type IV conjugative transfer system protein TraE [Holosporales bacterium]|nr:type IV conjugative transfer system protein TraE [Holosporales bacterium]